MQFSTTQSQDQVGNTKKGTYFNNKLDHTARVCFILEITQCWPEKYLQ